MEATGHAVAKTTGVGEPYTMIEAATHAMTETVTSEMGGTYAAAETRSVMRDGPLGAYAHVAEAVAVPAIKYSPAGIAD